MITKPTSTQLTKSRFHSPFPPLKYTLSCINSGSPHSHLKGSLQTNRVLPRTVTCTAHSLKKPNNYEATFQTDELSKHGQTDRQAGNNVSMCLKSLADAPDQGRMVFLSRDNNHSDCAEMEADQVIWDRHREVDRGRLIAKINRSSIHSAKCLFTTSTTINSDWDTLDGRRSDNELTR